MGRVVLPLYSDLRNQLMEQMHQNAINSLSGSNPMDYYTDVEKLYILPNDNFDAIDFSEMNVIEEDDNNPKYKFLVGEKYALRNVFNQVTKVYELVDVIDKFNDVNVNYVLMKQIDGDDSNSFSLSKHDCEELGIEYQDGLLPFPKNMNWERVIDKVEFDKDDLSTTPKSYIDNTIRYMLLVLNGFEDYSDGYILSPSGKLVKESNFLNSFKVFSKEPITYNNSLTIRNQTTLKAKIIKPNHLVFNHGNFISNENKIYVLIDLSVYKCGAKDNLIGINPSFVKGVSPSKIISIVWNEFGCLTVDEYEKEKAEKKRIKEEKIRKLEAQRKQYEAERTNVKSRLNHVVRTAPNIDFNSLSNMNVNNRATMDIYTVSANEMFDAVQKVFVSIDDEMNSVYRNLAQMNWRFLNK